MYVILYWCKLLLNIYFLLTSQSASSFWKNADISNSWNKLISGPEVHIFSSSYLIVFASLIQQDYIIITKVNLLTPCYDQSYQVYLIPMHSSETFVPIEVIDFSV